MLDSGTKSDLVLAESLIAKLEQALLYLQAGNHYAAHQQLIFLYSSMQTILAVGDMFDLTAESEMEIEEE